jgi:hypothetical protein
MSALNVIRQHILEHQCRAGREQATTTDIQAWCDSAGATVHIAIMVEPYLSKIERGEKYIESRLTKVNISPFERARPGDVILFKRSGGAIVAMAEVNDVHFQLLTAPQTLAALVEEYADGLSYEPDYAESKAEARYASLLWLRGVQELDALPLQKRGRQAWLTFEPAGSHMAGRSDLTLY